MTFNDFLNKAWDDHATDSQKVADSLRDGINLLESNDQIPSMVHLMTHLS